MPLRPRPWHFLIIAALLAACFLGFRAERKLAPRFPGVPVRTEGTFPLNGENADDPLLNGDAIRRWGSWAESDQNLGTLRIGPFAAPHRLRIAVSGFPNTAGNQIYLERVGTSDRHAIHVRDVQSKWLVVDIAPPDAWIGQPVSLVAVDGSTALMGWLAVTEPLSSGPGERNGALFLTLTCWLLNGVVFGMLWTTALCVVARRRSVPACWVPLVAAGCVACAGYVLFWLYFAHPALGKAGSALLAIAAAFLAWHWRDAQAKREVADETRNVAVLLVTIGLFYLTLLHLFPSSREFYDLAANRLREELPSDNTLPHNTALTLYVGGNLRPQGGDWLTSDRPPLQTGWQMITLPFTRALRLDDQTATGTASVWFQLLWIPAAYGLFRTLNITRGRATAWVVLLALTGFFAQNTLFTWPKLSAAAFGCGAFALWVLGRQRSQEIAGEPVDTGTGPSAAGGPTRNPENSQGHHAIGGMLAGLAWMSHGGIAFSFLALAPWILWRLFCGEVRGWLVAATVFLVFALPWLAFQKFYNPPGDRLIKWHLAGTPGKDSRGAWTVIREAYRSKPTAEIISAKIANLQLQRFGDWQGMLKFTPVGAPKRRNDEFFCTGRALTWWTLGLVALLLALLSRSRRARFASVGSVDGALVTWTVLTVLIWCLLMFDRYSAAIHQGSYATLLVLFVLMSAWLDRAAHWLLYLVAILQVATFTTTWAGPNSHLNGPASGWPFLAIACALLLAVFLQAIRTAEKPIFPTTEP